LRATDSQPQADTSNSSRSAGAAHQIVLHFRQQTADLFLQLGGAHACRIGYGDADYLLTVRIAQRDALRGHAVI